jgi:hypothetical protein
LKGILRGLTETQVETDPVAVDRRLRGRTYAIPFERVWAAATSLARGELRGWMLSSADDQEGVILGSAKPLLFGDPCDVRVEIGLDENAQTRVDARSSLEGKRGDLGRNRRTLGRFFRALDRSLAAAPEQILDPTLSPAWLDPS